MLAGKKTIVNYTRRKEWSSDSFFFENFECGQHSQPIFLSFFTLNLILILFAIVQCQLNDSQSLRNMIKYLKLFKFFTHLQK